MRGEFLFNINFWAFKSCYVNCSRYRYIRISNTGIWFLNFLSSAFPLDPVILPILCFKILQKYWLSWKLFFTVFWEVWGKSDGDGDVSETIYPKHPTLISFNLTWYIFFNFNFCSGSLLFWMRWSPWFFPILLISSHILSSWLAFQDWLPYTFGSHFRFASCSSCQWLGMVFCFFLFIQNAAFISPCFSFLPCSPLSTWFFPSPLCPRCWPFSGLVLQPSAPTPVFSRCSSSIHSLPWSQEC